MKMKPKKGFGHKTKKKPPKRKASVKVWLRIGSTGLPISVKEERT
jgi:hypothetical protein